MWRGCKGSRRLKGGDFLAKVGWYEVPIWESDATPTYQDFLDNGLDIGGNSTGRHTYVMANNKLGFTKCCYYMAGGYLWMIFAINPNLAAQPIDDTTHYIWGWSKLEISSKLYTPRSGSSTGRFFSGDTFAYGDFIYSADYGNTTATLSNMDIPRYATLSAAKEALNDGIWKHVEPNYDPYGDGGESTTGGGGGSFDGTTEIINEPDTPLVNVSATKFVSLYNPTESQLNNLAYFMWHTLDPTTWIKVVADPMDAIISLSVLPIAIPSSSASDISVGGISTGVSCNLASAQYISFDAGTITVPQYSNSYLDYAPYTTISIYLPYVGLRKIPTDLVMGKVLGVKYRIDIFTGACCVYITVGDSVILQFTGNCAQQIPFTSSNWTQAITTMISMIGSGVMAVANPATAALSVAGMANSAVNGLHADIETGGANGGNVGFLGVQKPYIIIQRPKQCIPANQNTFTGYPSYITATFGDLKGYTEVDKIILENINATENELNELESLLKGGVYVNEL